MNHNDPEGQDSLPTYAEQVSVVVRMLRTLFQMSQTDLAKASGVSRPTINRVETQREVENIRTGTLEALLAVFRRLGVQVEVSDQRLTVSLPMDSVLAAIAAGKRQRTKGEVNPGKQEIMARAVRRSLGWEEPLEVSREDLERFRKMIDWGSSGGDDGQG